MPIRLVLHDLPHPLVAAGVVVATTRLPMDPPVPWAIYHLLEQHSVFPAKAALRVARCRLGILEGLNAGTWTVGIVDISEELGMTREAFALLSADEQEVHRGLVRDRFLEAGADAVIDGLHELPDAIEALNQLG
jgi:phosphonoacetaldehyde hydrolase